MYQWGAENIKLGTKYYIHKKEDKFFRTLL